MKGLRNVSSRAITVTNRLPTIPGRRSKRVKVFQKPLISGPLSYRDKPSCNKSDASPPVRKYRVTVQENLCTFAPVGRRARPVGGVAASAVLLVLTGVGAFAQGGRGAAPAPPSDPHDLSGVWELRYDSANVARASLLPAVNDAALNTQLAKDRHAVRWCNYVGLPQLMNGTIDIVQSDREVVISSEARSIVRHIYSDGRKHVSLETFDNTTNGNSIGSWQGNTFVVDTVGFSDQGVTGIPGGGFRTTGSHLVERFRLLSGDRMVVTSTWTDPKVYAKPQVYQYIYYRSDPNYVPRLTACDPFDEERAQLLTDGPRGQ